MMATKHADLQNVGEELVSLHVSHSNLKQHSSQSRFSLHSTIQSVKERLSRNCGTAVGAMVLQLYDESDNKLCEMTDESRPLGFYSPLDGYRIHVVDLDPASFTATGWLEDTSLVEKYTMTDDDYNKRTDTFRKFKEKKIAEDPSWSQHKIDGGSMGDLAALIHCRIISRKICMLTPHPPLSTRACDHDDSYHADLVSISHKVGDRCEIDPGGKRGVVMFVGKAETLGAGTWIGIQYDEPLGKHDGMVKGKRYFRCPANHGAMVRPDKVKVGDYKELDPFDNEEI